MAQADKKFVIKKRYQNNYVGAIQAEKKLAQNSFVICGGVKGKQHSNDKIPTTFCDR